MRIARTIHSAVQLMPALACLLLVLWSCNGIVSAAKADTDGGPTACPACPERVPVNGG